MSSTEDVTRAILDAWDEDEEQSMPEPTMVETPEPDEAEAEPEPETEEEEVGEDGGEEEDLVGEQADEEGADTGEEEGGDEADATEISAAYEGDDPEIRAFLSKYQGDIEKALRGAAELSRAFGRQGSEQAELRARVAELEQMMLEAQSLQGFETPMTEEQRNWVEEAASSASPGAFVRQAIVEGQYEMARSVCREWAKENPFEANRAGQYVDMAEQQVYASYQQPTEASTDQVLHALGEAMPELQSWWPQMAHVVSNLGQGHPLVQEARSGDADTAMRGIIGIYEIARASTASVQEQKDKIKRRNREAADGARKSAVVSSAANSPKTAETPRPVEIMPGLTWQDLETEFAKP